MNCLKCDTIASVATLCLKHWQEFLLNPAPIKITTPQSDQALADTIKSVSQKLDIYFETWGSYYDIQAEKDKQLKTEENKLKAEKAKQKIKYQKELRELEKEYAREKRIDKSLKVPTIRTSIQNPKVRQQLFERDDWCCKLCHQWVNSTLAHPHPYSPTLESHPSGIPWWRQ